MVNLIHGIKQSCLRCGKKALITDAETGEILCGSCGFVLSERIEDSGPEWRTFFDDGIDGRRTGDGTSLTMHDQGLSTIINPTNKDATGKPLSPSMKSTIGRLRIWDIRSQNNVADRNFRQAFAELYKKMVRGRSISALIASALYAACREVGTPRTLNDIGHASNIKRKDIARCYRLLVNELDLKMPVVDSVQNVARIASKIGISEKTKRYASEILRKAEENKISAGKNPMALAATALYISCVKMGVRHTQRDLAEAANVTEVTIRNRHKGLLKLLKN